MFLRTTVAVLGIVAALTTAALWLCQGHLVYSLDDPYISLGLGWHIFHGHYGINSAEYSSASSSILYPFLLAPFAPLALQQAVPLLINTSAVVATAAVLVAMARHYGIGAHAPSVWRMPFLIVVLCLALNLFGLVFTGLEHSLQVLDALAILFGLALTLERDCVPAWLLPAIVCAPLLRFEGLGEALLALVVLGLAGRVRLALGGVIAIGVLLGLYVKVMAGLGLPPLPSSVLAKSVVLAPGSSFADYLREVFDRAVASAGHSRLAYVTWSVMALAALHPWLRSSGRLPMEEMQRLTVRTEWTLLAVTAGVLLAQTLLGPWTGQHRYEIHAVALTAAATIIVWHREITSLVTRAGLFGTVVTAAVILCVTLPYVRGTVLVPWASRGIYEQQYQLRRFAVDFYQLPVAVNDLGWISYRNPSYVLDLMGLASEPVRRARLAPVPGWPETFTREHNVGLAIIYRPWFAQVIPQDWRPVAELRGAHAPVTAAYDTVTFYATSSNASPAILAALHAFAAELPTDVASIAFLADEPRSGLSH